MREQPYIQQFRLGGVTVSLLTTGYLTWNLTQEMQAPMPPLAQEWQSTSTQPSVIPTQCIHIQTPSLSLQIDACDHNAFLDTEYEQHEIAAPPTLVAQLTEIGVKASEITHVLLTHHHFDHISNATVLEGKEFVPTFPKATYYLGRADWESAPVQKSLQNPHSLSSHTLGVLEQRGKLVLIDKDLALDEYVQVLDAPGESPGHKIVRLQVGAQVLYFIADLYHHPIEIAYPDWMIVRDDIVGLKRSREAFIERALREDALFVASHIAGVRHLLSPLVSEPSDAL